MSIKPVRSLLALGFLLALSGDAPGASQAGEPPPGQPEPSLTATPNPVPAGVGVGSTTVSWDVGVGREGRLMVSEDGAPATLFAVGPRGSSPAPWIRTGSTYDFHLYNPERGETSLASIRVTRREGLSGTAVFAIVASIFLVAVLVIGSRFWTSSSTEGD